MRHVFFILFLSYAVSSFALDGYMFRVQLSDKGNTSSSVDTPEHFLSKRAIERRLNQNIPIEINDLPISDDYIRAIEKLGFVIVAKSKWMSTISVFCKDSLDINKVESLGFVDNAQFVWKSDTTEQAKPKRSPVLKKIKPFEKSQTKYGYAYDQIKTLNGDYLHEMSYTGKGVEIAVIDAGYRNLNQILLLDNVHIKGIKDFVYDGGDIFESADHGLEVLSVMATNTPNTYIGTAPGAKYWLLRSEDSRSEYPIEEDYWISAAEYADSIGVDIINTSLGYYRFDPPARSYTKDELNGKTAFISKAADIASSKGMLIEISAGNDGRNAWGKIAFPADIKNGLIVGAMDRDSLIASFSSRGLTADDRIKPDVVALGAKILVIGTDGEIKETNGTSFSGPVISGLVACLWEAFPKFSSLQLIDIIRQSSDKYNNPDSSFGYGIPNMKKAFELARKYDEEYKSAHN